MQRGDHMPSHGAIMPYGGSVAVGGTAVWSSYDLLHRENSIDIQDLFKSKLL